MKQMTKLTAMGIAAAGLLAACGGTGQADDSNYPSDTVELIVPFGAGGATDTVARSFSSSLEDSLEETVVVVNRPGGGAAIGATEAASATPDGHTLFLSTASSFITTPMLEDVSYSPEDFKGILGIAEQPYVLIAASDSDWDSLADVARTNDRLTYGITGTGNNTHISAGMFFHEEDITAEPVPFDAATNVIQAVSGGQIDIAAVDLNVALPQIDSDSVKALGVTAPQRSEALPDVETFDEAGYPELSNIQSRIGIVVPAETPDEVVDTLTAAAEQAVESDSFQEYLKANHLSNAEYRTGDDLFNRWIPEETQIAQEAFEALGISAED